MIERYETELLFAMQMVLGLAGIPEINMGNDKAEFIFANVPSEECARINLKILDSLNERLLLEAFVQRDVNRTPAPNFIDPPVTFTGISVDGNTVKIDAEYSQM